MLEQEVYAVLREIKMHGEEFVIFCDEYNQMEGPTGGKKVVTSFPGLFHFSKGYSSQNVSDATVTHNLGSPMILCILDDIRDVKREHFLYKNGKRYDITDINDIGGYGKIADLSLEVVVDGRHEY